MIGTSAEAPYRGRLAPSPTGYLHLGHARTFWIAQQRATERAGRLILRSEDLDRSRVRPEFQAAMIEDLTWFGFHWEEGPDCGGPHAPYCQSARLNHYRAALHRLQELGVVYPCRCSRRDIQSSIHAPHAQEEEPIYPGTCRPGSPSMPASLPAAQSPPCHYRYRVPDGEVIEFTDGGMGGQRFTAGQDFGDFVVWRNDDVPAYQLAVVVDDSSMGITEVVRGADLLLSTARQLLLYRALKLEPPRFYHCELMLDEQGRRLAKRHDALSLRALRSRQFAPEALRARLFHTSTLHDPAEVRKSQSSTAG